MSRITRRLGIALAAVLASLAACGGGGGGGGSSDSKSSPSGSRRTSRPGRGHPGDRRTFTKKSGGQGQAGRGRRGPVQPDPHLQRCGRGAAGRDRRAPAGPGPHPVVQRAHRHRRRRRGGRRPRRGTFSDSALELTADGDTQLARAQRVVGAAAASTARTSSTRPGWAPRRRTTTSWPRPRRSNSPSVAGFVGANVAGDAFTEQTFEEIGLGNDCQLVDDGGEGHLRQPRVRGGARLLRQPAAELLGHRRPGRRHHAGRVLRRQGRDGRSGRASSSTRWPACATTPCRPAPSASRTPRSWPRTAAW